MRGYSKVMERELKEGLGWAEGKAAWHGDLRGWMGCTTSGTRIRCG